MIPFTSLLPSLAFVWPSNCGFRNFTLINHNARILIKGIHTDTLKYIASENSQLDGFNDSEIEMFKAEIKGARIQAYNGIINNLTLTTEKSTTNFTTKLGSVNAKIRDNSNATFKSCNEMNIDKDSSSKI